MKEYIDAVLGFYFDGGFDQMIADAQLDKEEIEKWGNLAVLFNYCFGDVSSFSDKEKDEAFCLVEALYTKLEVDLMFGDIDKSSLNEVCEGYDFDETKYIKEIEKGVQLIESEGLELFRHIGRDKI